MPRVKTELPVEVCLLGSSLPGRVKNISETGLLILVPEPVPSGTRGQIRLRIGGCVVQLDVTVAYTDFLQVGLTFLFSSPVERDFVKSLVRFLNRPVIQD